MKSNPPWEVRFHWKAQKYLEKLSRIDKERIQLKVDKLILSPFSGRPLSGRLRGFYRIRIGDYRVVYEPDLHDKIIIVAKVGRRGDIY